MSDQTGRKWHRLDEGFGVTAYELRDEAGTPLATIYQGGKSGYRWTVSIPGKRGWDSTNLSEAKADVGRELDLTRAKSGAVLRLTKDGKPDMRTSQAVLDTLPDPEPLVCPDPSHAAYREAHDALAALVNRKPSELPNWQPAVVAELIIEDLQRALAAVVEAERGTARHFEAGCQNLPELVR